MTWPWAPTPDEVAKVLQAFTRGGYDDDDRIFAGAEHGTFDDTTSPTEEDVAELIEASCDEVAGRVAVPITLKDYTLAKTTAKWHAAMNIAGEKVPAGTDDAGGLYRMMNSNFVASMSSLVESARSGQAPRLS